MTRIEAFEEMLPHSLQIAEDWNGKINKEERREIAREVTVKVISEAEKEMVENIKRLKAYIAEAISHNLWKEEEKIKNKRARYYLTGTTISSLLDKEYDYTSWVKDPQ